MSHELKAKKKKEKHTFDNAQLYLKISRNFALQNVYE